jgi:hypothetical protein
VLAEDCGRGNVRRGERGREGGRDFQARAFKGPLIRPLVVMTWHPIKKKSFIQVMTIRRETRGER